MESAALAEGDGNNFYKIGSLNKNGGGELSCFHNIIRTI